MRLVDKIKRFVVWFKNYDNETAELRKMLSRFDHDIRILDVGCGLGDKFKLLETMGFTNVVGVEKNPTLAKLNIDGGRKVVTIEEFHEDYKDSKFDLILMSHLIEHFQWEELMDFMDDYLSYAGDDGYLLIISPVYHTMFYNNFDHIKPYLPLTIRNFFGDLEVMEPVQVRPRHRLELVDLAFRRAPLSLLFFRSLYFPGVNKIPRLANLFLALVFRLSFRLLGKTTGWIGLFRKTGVGKDNPSVNTIIC